MITDMAETRRDMAAVFRWTSRMGLSEGICNHISLAVDDTKFLVNPQGLHWSELRAGDLLVVDHDGIVLEGQGVVEPTALFIHARIHLGLPHARCVLHTHMPYATAITSIEGGRVVMANQNALRFFNDIAYSDEYDGLALDAAEGDRICGELGDKRVLFLASHGVIVVGPSLAVGFDDLYYLERACQVQIIAQSTQMPLKIVDDQTAEKTRQQFRQSQLFAEDHLRAIRRILDRECPDYAT
ncbi:MAG: aldolase [Fuerstiella sp.]|nr:aldolase [Fuerstiella sp.]